MKWITLEMRYFKNKEEWDYLLRQLDIPENERGEIREVELTITDFEIK